MLIPVAVVNESPGTPQVMIPPVPGYAGLWDPSDASTLTLTANYSVSQMNDKSGNGANAVQATEGSQPKAMVPPSDIYLGRGALAFDIDFVSISGIRADDRTQTLFCVAMVGSLADYRSIFSANAQGGRQIRLDQTTGKVTCNRQFVDGIFTTTTLAATVGVPFVLCVALDTTTWECRMSGQTTESGSQSSAFNTASGSHIGYNASTVSEYFFGTIGEIIIYNTTLSSGDIDSTMAYLCAKWGIAP